MEVELLMLLFRQSLVIFAVIGYETVCIPVVLQFMIHLTVLDRHPRARFGPWLDFHSHHSVYLLAFRERFSLR